MEADHNEPLWKIIDWTNEASQLVSAGKKPGSAMKGARSPNAKSKTRETKVKVAQASTVSEPLELEKVEPNLLDSESRTMSSVVEARLSAMELLDMSVEQCLICNSSAYALSLDANGEVCVSDEHVLICHDCGECYHTYCLDPPVARKSFLKPNANGWRCPHCKFCVLCQESHNENDLVVCDRCDRCYHSYCAQLPPSELHGDQWLCSDCKICSHCHQSFSLISDDIPPYRRYALCSPCNAIYDQRIKPIADRIRSLIKVEHEKRSFIDSSAPPAKRPSSEPQPPHTSHKSISTSRNPSSNLNPPPEALPKFPGPLSLPPLPSTPRNKFPDMPTSLSLFSPHIPFHPPKPHSFNSLPDSSSSHSSWQIPSSPHHPPHLLPNDIPATGTRAPSLPQFTNLPGTVPTPEDRPSQPFMNPAPPRRSDFSCHPGQMSHSDAAMTGQQFRGPHSGRLTLNGPLPQETNFQGGFNAFNERGGVIPMDTEKNNDGFRGLDERSMEVHHAHHPLNHGMPISESHMPPTTLSSVMEVKKGRMIQHAGIAHNPFSLPSEATLIVVGRDGGNRYPSPRYPWMQMFELTEEGYFKLCGFFGGVEAFYQQLPVFFVPEGQFPIVEECPTADIVMAILLQGATPETIPPFILPNHLLIPPGTMILPPRELIQQKQRYTSVGNTTPQIMHTSTQLGSQPSPRGFDPSSAPHQSLLHSGAPSQRLPLGHPLSLPFLPPSTTATPSQAPIHPSQIPTTSPAQPSHFLPHNTHLPPSFPHYGQRHTHNPALPGRLPSHIMQQPQQMPHMHPPSFPSTSHPAPPQMTPNPSVSHPLPQHLPIGMPQMEPRLAQGPILPSFGVSPPTYVNGHIDLSHHPSSVPDMFANALHPPQTNPPQNEASIRQSKMSPSNSASPGSQTPFTTTNMSTKGLGSFSVDMAPSKPQGTKKDVVVSNHGSAAVLSQNGAPSQVNSAPKPKRRSANDPVVMKLKDLASKLHILMNGPPQLFILNMEPYLPQKVEIGQLKSEVVSKFVGFSIREEEEKKCGPESKEACLFASDFGKYDEMKVPWRGRDDRVCVLCKKLGDHVVLGRLLPFQLVDQWVHVCCAMWSNEVLPSEDGELMQLFQVVRKAKTAVCAHCKEKGASVICAVPACQRKFHLPCLLQTPCRLNRGPFSRYAICMDHAKDHTEVKWLSTRDKTVPLDSRKELPKGHFPWSHFHFHSKLHLSEPDIRHKIAKQEGEVSLDNWTRYVFRSGALCVSHIGAISTRAPFHSKDYIFPVGYRATRRFWSWKVGPQKLTLLNYPSNTPSSALTTTTSAPLGPSSSSTATTASSSSISAGSSPSSPSPLTEASATSHYSSSSPTPTPDPTEWVWQRTDYEMTIEEEQGRMKVKIVAMDDPEHPIESNNLEKAWNEVVVRVNQHRANFSGNQEGNVVNSPLSHSSSRTVEVEDASLGNHLNATEELDSDDVNRRDGERAAMDVELCSGNEMDGIAMDGSAMDGSVDGEATVKRRSVEAEGRKERGDWVVNMLPFGFFWGLESHHMSSHLERLPGARMLDKYTRKHDMVIRLPSVLSVAVARYFDPETRPEILTAPPNESGAARCDPYRKMESLERFRQVDAMPCHPAASLVKFKELARTRSKFNQPLYPQPTDTNIRGAITAQNMTSYSKLTRFRIMKASENIRLKVLRSKIQGRGLFLMEDACEGEFLIEYVGEVISHRLADEREKNYQSEGIGCYMFTLNIDFVIDATTKGNSSRFINHSCEPNCETQIEVIDGTPRIVIYAKSAIKHGEELTYDYHFEPELEKLKCYCGAPSCRGYMN